MPVHERALICGRIGAALLLAAGLPLAHGALPAKVKATHPHVFVDAARVEAIRANLPQPASFPARGSLQFAFTPKLPLAQAVNTGDASVFDGYDAGRNHVFVRHVQSYDVPAGSPPTIGLQVALQSAQLGGGYIAAARIDLPADVPAVLQLSWDAATHTASYRVNGGGAVAMNWARQGNGQPVEWTPDGQHFAFWGRYGEQVADVRLADLATGSVTSYPSIDLNVQRSWANVKAAADRYAGTLLACSVPADPATCGSPVVLTGKEPTHPLTVEAVAEALGMAWLVTGQGRYRDAALNYASQLLRVPYAEGGEFYMRGRIAAMGMIYDWLYGVVSTTAVRGAGGAGRYDTALAGAIVATITATDAGGRYPLGEMICGRQPLTTSPLDCAAKPVIEGWDPVADAGKPSIASYYLSGHQRNDVHAIAQALAAIANERPEANAMLDTAWQHFDRGFYRARNWAGIDGGHQMGWYYGFANSSYEPLELWRSALDWSSPPAVPSYAKRQFLFSLYGMRGTVPASFPKTGDVFDGSWDDSMASAALYGSQYGDVTIAPVSQWLYDNYILPQRSGGNLWDLLLWRPGKATRAPDSLPLSGLFRVSGQVLMRDSWQFANATLLEFESASFTSENHQHFDQNSLALFYKAPLLVDSGYYDGYGIQNSIHWGNYYIRSIAHNTATVFDPSESFSLWGTPYSNDGGQWLFDGKVSYPTIEQAQTGVNALDGVVRYQYGSDYTYTAGNASRAYAKAKVDPSSGYLRQVLFLRKPGFWARPVTVVYDQVKVVPGKEGLAKSVLWHSVNEPVVNHQAARGPGVWDVPAVSGSQLVEVRNGGGLAYLQTLLPAAPKLRKIGGADASGAGWRFAAPQRQPDGSYQLTDFRPKATEAKLATEGDMGAWRVEVTDAQPKALSTFLHVISVADDGSVSAPPAARRLAADAGTEAVLLGESLVAVFRAQGLQGTSHGLKVDNPRGRRYLVTGLAPNQAYAMNVSLVIGSTLSYVTFTPSSSGAYRTTAQGVLTVN